MTLLSMRSAANPDTRPIAVLGAGSWGTALAWLLAENGREVLLWGRDAQRAREIDTARENARYLPGLSLSSRIRVTTDLPGATATAALIVLAVPTQAIRATTRAVAEAAAETPCILAAKGLERETGMRLTQVVEEELSAGGTPHVAVLSGPNLSAEIVRRVPTATVVAAGEPDLARELQHVFSTPFFRVYTNSDVAGVELGGALKNPLAIAAGICDGLGYGSNTRASLLTRGLAEMTRLGVAAGARAATFSGLSGLGDLLATAHSPLSRNYRLGLALGQGDTLEHAREALHQVAEGVPTTEAACRLAADLGVEAPILEELHRVLFAGDSPTEAVQRLLSRRYRDEEEHSPGTGQEPDARIANLEPGG